MDGLMHSPLGTDGQTKSHTALWWVIKEQTFHTKNSQIKHKLSYFKISYFALKTEIWIIDIFVTMVGYKS